MRAGLILVTTRNGLHSHKASKRGEGLFGREFFQVLSSRYALAGLRSNEDWLLTIDFDVLGEGPYQ